VVAKVRHLRSDGRASEHTSAALEPDDAGTSSSETSGIDQQRTQLSFFDELKAIPEEEWDKYRVYVYRRRPKIIKSDQPHYIDCVRRPIDEQFLLDTYGSGLYSIRLNDNKRTIKTFVCEVHHLDRPPRIDPAELVECAENERYIELWPREMGKETKGIKAENGAPTSDATLAELTKLIGKLVEQKTGQQSSPEAERVTSTLVQWALNQAAAERDADRAAENPGKLTELVKALKELTPPLVPAPPQPDPLVLVDLVLSIAEKLRPAPALPASDPLQSVDRTLDLINKLQEVAGTDTTATISSAPTEGTWQEVGRLVVDLLKPAVPVFATALTQSFGRNPTAPQRPQTLPTASKAKQSTTGSDAASERPPDAKTDGQQPPAEPPVAGDEQATIDSAQLGIAIQLATLAGSVLSLGMDGGFFGDRIEYLYGARAVDMVGDQSAEQVLQMLQAVPQAWQYLAPYQVQLPKFFEEFYEWANQPEEDSDHVETTTPPGLSETNGSVEDAEIHTRANQRRSKKSRRNSEAA
jgi:hypothetical protein